MSAKFRPEGAIVGDTIPFFWEGTYHVFYLKGPDTHDIPLRFKTSWGHLVSTDLVTWEEMPVGLELGPEGSPDATGVWHGTVVERDGIFHLLYTGYNSKAPDYPQTICHATSKDLIQWEKDANNPVLLPDPREYEPRDWRDPWVFWNEDEGRYWMLITARRRTGPFLKRGCLVLATSSDLSQWKVDSTFWAPDLTFTYEASQLFQWGNTWYLLWNDFSMPMAMYYRIGDSARGPWRTPRAERFDGTYFYGGKTVKDDVRHLVFAWLPTRFGENDDGYWEWGGDLVIPREITKQADSSFAFKCPSQITDSYSKTLPISIEPRLGEWNYDSQNRNIVGERDDGLGYVIIPVQVNDFLFEVRLRLEVGTSAAGILFKTEPNFSQGYLLRFDPAYHRVVIDHWPLPVHRPWSAPPQSVFPPGTPMSKGPSPLVEQPFDFAYGDFIKCQLFVSDSTIQCFVGDRVVLTYRVYRDVGAPLGLFLQGGKVQFEDVKLKIS